MTDETRATKGAAAALLLVSTLTIMVGSVVAPVLPTLAERTGMGANASWLLTLPSLGVVLFGPFAGRLIEWLGGRRAMLVGMAAYGVLGAAGAFIDAVPLLLADRLALGFATVVVMAAGTVLISELYAGDARLRMIARQGMSIELGGVVFLALGGALAAFGWRLPFGLYLLAFAFLLPVALWVPRTPATQASASADETPPQGVRDIYLAATLAMVLFFASFITLPGSLSAQGLSETMIGYYLASVSMVAVIAAGVMPRTCRMFGDRGTILLAFAAFAAGHAVYAVGAEGAGLALAALLMGTGFGFSIPVANHAVVARSPVGARARNLGMLSSAIFLGQFLSSFLELASPGPAQTFALASGLAVVAGLVFALVSRPGTALPARG
ncbi:MFS transporter [Halovulum sp. GXIMD14794]